MTVFPISKVNSLRQRAMKACPPPQRDLVGWNKSDADPMRLLAVFSALRIRPGFVLRAYQFCDGGNGNGRVLAMPTDAPFPEPVECFDFAEPPQPPFALGHPMDAVDGDGTPWSFLSASILSREIDEFGAMWHGCDWSTHTILGADPWNFEPQAKVRHRRQPLAGSPVEQWEWKQPRPEAWEPTVDQAEEAVIVKFFTMSGLGCETIYRWTDTYKPGSYRPETLEEDVANGPGGFVF